ncbi:L-lactate permease [Deltaproteobacteria bacterium]|nr:L-lactate permease [Deltaproteobacteria bacterium]
MKASFLFWIAISPIVCLVLSLGVLKLKSHAACAGTMGLTAVLAVVFWDMSLANTGSALLEGCALAFWPIIWVTIAAIFTYNVSLRTGSMEKITLMLSGITTDRRILVVLLAWGFGGFMEAIAGYGTAVAIPAGILTSLGFNPLFSVVVCLVANTSPTAFGAVGVPLITLASVTDMDVLSLSFTVAIQLLLPILIIPFVLVLFTDRRIRALKETGIAALFAGAGFGIPQLFVAKHVGPELAALLGSIVSMSLTILAIPLCGKKEQQRPAALPAAECLKACGAFILVFVFVLLSSSLVPPIHAMLATIKTAVVIYTGEGAKPFSFPWLATPGSMIILATFLGARIQGMAFAKTVSLFAATVFQLRFSIMTVLSIVAFSKVFSYSGMVTDIALVLADISGSFYPVTAPLIGALGTFLTGSDTSANVLFGSLQKQVAENLSLEPYWIVAANTSGATLGKMISPQSIAVGAAAVGLSGSEGKILSITIRFCAGFIVLLGMVIYGGSTPQGLF